MSIKPVNLNVSVKAGILSTVAGSVYSSAIMKVREAISNSRDNNAKNCIFYCEKHTEHTHKVKLTMIDDGDGITSDRFKEIFESIGYGLKRDNLDAYSYFGLGLMSIFKLGTKVTIFSKPSKGAMHKVVVAADKLFSEESENEEIGKLSKYVTISPSSMAERDKISPLASEYAFHKDRIKNDKFTEIVVEGVHYDDYRDIISPSFKEEIRKITPLAASKADPFFNNLTDADKDKIFKLYENKKFFPTLNYFYGIGTPTTIKPLTKYFPQFDLPGNNKFTLYLCEQNPLYSIYVLYSTKDLTPDKAVCKETGFWIRNKNFLVKSSDFLNYQGSKSFIQEPLTNWIFSEISHSNMKLFLDVTRNNFVTKSDKFQEFRNDVKEKVHPLNNELRTIYTHGIQRATSVVQPFEDIGTGDKDKDPFKRAEVKLLNIVKKKSEKEKFEEIHENLDKISDAKLDKASDIYTTIVNKNEVVKLEDSKHSYVFIDPKLKSTSYKVEYDSENSRAIVRIAPSVFQPKKIVFFAKTYNVKYVDGKGTQAGISINRKSSTIAVNIFSAEIKNYSMKFVDVLLVVEYAYKMSDDHHQMRRYILDLLGGGYEKVKTLYNNLSDNI